MRLSACGALMALIFVTQTPAFDTVRFEARMGDCDPEEPGCSWVRVAYPTFVAGLDEGAVAALRRTVDELVLLPVVGEEPARAVEDLATGLFREYRLMVEEGFEPPAGWWLERTMEVVWQREGVLTLRMAEVSYVGGAHPNHFDSWLLIGPGGRPVTLEATIVPGGDEELRAIGERAFRAYHGLPPDEPLDGMGFWFDDGRFELNDNWGATEEGLVFHFNPYEVAAYALGHTEIVLPWREVEHLLRDDGPLGGVTRRGSPAR